MTSFDVKTGPGGGVVSRRRDWVLFVPDCGDLDPRSSVVLDAFAEASDDTVRGAIGDAVVAASFDVPPFALFGFSADVVFLRVFGELEVTSTLPTAPMISGRGSGTWVDHSAPGQNGATISVGADVDERTCLRDGAVVAGGIALVVRDPDILPVAPDVAATSAGRVTREPSSKTLKPEVAQVLRDEVNDQVDPVASVVEPPVESDKAAVSGFTLVFDDGLDIDVDGPLVIGRKPLVDDVRDRAVAVNGERVSRTHLRVEVVAELLQVTDLDSHNGSAVVRAATGLPEELPAATAVSVGDADRVLIGSQAFTVHAAGLPDA